MAYGGAGGGDAEWEGIIAAKNELLTVKDDALAELQQDLARQKAMVARLFKEPADTAGSTSYGGNAAVDRYGSGGHGSDYVPSDWTSTGRLETTAADRARGTAYGSEALLVQDVENKNRRIASLELEMLDLREEIRRLEDDNQAKQHLAATAVDAAEQRALHTQLAAHEDLAKLQSRLDQREQQVLELEREQHSSRLTENELRSRVVTLEDYIAELPTNEEFVDRGDELAKYQRRADLLEIKLEEAETELQLLTDSLAARDGEVASAHDEVAKISALLDESRAARTAEVELVEKSREQLVIEMDKMAQSLKETRDHLAETEAARLAYKQRVEEMGALYADEEERGRRNDATLAALRGDVKQLQQRERHQQSTINALEDLKFTSERKVAAQASTIRELRQALNSLRSANQELLGGNVVTRTISIPEQHPGEDGSGIPTARSSARAAEVQDALADCLHELQALVHTVEAKSRGEEPPIGEMLGLERPAELGAHFVRTNDPDEQLHTIAEMRRTVAQLRQQVCNKYAGDLGPEACAMQ